MLPSEVKRVETAMTTGNKRELEWSLWYARMRQSVPSARPADVKYWRAVESQVQDILEPPPPPQVYAINKKKKGVRGLGASPLPGETESAAESTSEESPE
jgi:hypothetical protein